MTMTVRNGAKFQRENIAKRERQRDITPVGSNFISFLESYIYTQKKYVTRTESIF